MSEELELSFNLEGSMQGSGTSARKFDRLRVEKDSTVQVRILPPFGTKHGGMLYKKYSIHWGFTTEEGGKRPVSCSYPTERFCPVCEAVKEAKNELETYKDKKSGKYTGGSKERVEELLAYVKVFDVNNFFALNAVTYDGRTVILELKKTGVDNLMAKIAECVQKRKFDPISITTGAWFEISRTGMGLMTKYPVEIKKILKKTEDGEAEFVDRTPLSADLIESIKAQLADPDSGGPMYDIHALHEPSTAVQLKGYMNGDPLPGRSKPEAKAEEPAAEAQAEEPGDVPEVSYQMAPAEPEQKASAPKAPAKLSPAPPKPTAAAATPPKTSIASAATPKPGIANAQAEIARLRQMAAMKSGGAKASG